MKPPYLFLFIIFFSCTSSKNTTSSKLYPNNGENFLKNLGVSIVEKEDFYVFDTNDFSVNFPYSWRSYLEPIAKEMIYHSPFKITKSNLRHLLLCMFTTQKTLKEISIEDYDLFANQILMKS